MTHSVTISVEGIELRGRCGVTPEERAVGQTLVVDVSLEPAACRATQSDDLADTVNYGHVVKVVRALVEGGEYHLLERLATVIADALWEESDLHFLEVAVAKLAPPTAIPVTASRVRVVRTA